MLNSTWYFNNYKNTFDEDTCNNIIEDAYEHGVTDDNRVQGADGEFFDLKIIKDVDVYKALNEKLDIANKECKWNFDYTSIEEIKFIEMNTGHYSDWHLDSSFTNDVYNGTRKHTIIVMLSDPEEYNSKGIEIVGGLPNSEGDWNTLVPMNKGDMLVLPACVPYKVNVIEGGLQRLLVTHTIGPAWR